MMKQSTPTAAIYTLGCKVNQYESEAIAEALKEKQFQIVSFEETADVYIINTCTVTAESDRKACQMIRRAAKHGGACVIVTGCMAQTQADRIKCIEGVHYICGSRNKMSCVDAALQYVEKKYSEKQDASMEVSVLPKETKPVVAVQDLDTLGIEAMSLRHSEAERTRAYIKIEDGCENRCTYCAIPNARGNVVSKKPEDVLKEIGTLLQNGYHEIVLTGIEIASYGKDFTENDGGSASNPHTVLVPYHLVDLLEDIEKAYSDWVFRVRLGSLEPTYMKPEIVTRMANLKHLAPHFHLSLQSGSDHVLHGMKRKYNMQMVRAILADIRAKFPDVMFTTDIMMGFPGETEEDFMETPAFAKEAKLLHIHVFPYSKRENTAANTMPGQLSNTEKNRRANALIAVQKEIEADCYKEYAKCCVEEDILFLPETCTNGVITGHTGNFMEVRIPVSDEKAKDLMTHKTFCRVRIVDAQETYFIGEFVEEKV